MPQRFPARPMPRHRPCGMLRGRAFVRHLNVGTTEITESLWRNDRRSGSGAWRSSTCIKTKQSLSIKIDVYLSDLKAPVSLEDTSIDGRSIKRECLYPRPPFENNPRWHVCSLPLTALLQWKAGRSESAIPIRLSDVRWVHSRRRSRPSFRRYAVSPGR
jgi:hypothetical protein